MSTFRRILVDGDIVAFRAAASCEKRENGQVVNVEPLHIAIARADEILHGLMESLHCRDMDQFISGENNFRYNLYPEYKANRTQPKPRWLEHVKEHLVKNWGAQVTDGWEADDAIAMNMKEGYVIATIDKDMRQIPGWHFNFVKDELSHVSEREGIYNFYWHVLVGDSADNIKGCNKIGPVKATRALSVCESERDLYDVSRRLYQDDEQFILNGRLIWLMREPGKMWEPLVSEQEEDQ